MDDDHEEPREIEALREDAKNLLVGGATLGTFAAVTGAIFGATCPMCIVVAPVMLAAGGYKRWRLSCAERARQVEAEGSEPG